MDLLRRRRYVIGVSGLAFLLVVVLVSHGNFLSVQAISIQTPPKQVLPTSYIGPKANYLALGNSLALGHELGNINYRGYDKWLYDYLSGSGNTPPTTGSTTDAQEKLLVR